MARARRAAARRWATLQDDSTFTDPTVFRADRSTDDTVSALPRDTFAPHGGASGPIQACLIT
jgi:hypothetical protein